MHSPKPSIPWIEKSCSETDFGTWNCWIQCNRWWDTVAAMLHMSFIVELTEWGATSCSYQDQHKNLRLQEPIRGRGGQISRIEPARTRTLATVWHIFGWWWEVWEIRGKIMEFQWEESELSTHVASFVQRLVTPIAEKHVTTSMARISTPITIDMAIDMPKMISD